MAPPGTRVIVHNKPGNRTSWGHHVTKGWYIGPSLDHYRCMQCYMPATAIVLITDTLQYTPKAFAFPKTTIEYYMKQSIGDTIVIMNFAPTTLPFLSYVDTTKTVINQILQIFQRSTFQPHLKTFPLPPILPQSQNDNIQHQNIISTPAPAPRLEPVLNLQGCKHKIQHPHRL